MGTPHLVSNFCNFFIKSRKERFEKRMGEIFQRVVADFWTCSQKGLER